MSRRAPFVFILGLMASSAACAAPEEPDLPASFDHASDAQPAIAGGFTDDSDLNVVGIKLTVSAFEEYICSGSLIAPNLVLTARHCVSRLQNAFGDLITCGDTTAAAPYDPADFSVTTGTQMGFGPLPISVREVLIPNNND